MQVAVWNSSPFRHLSEAIVKWTKSVP